MWWLFYADDVHLLREACQGGEAGTERDWIEGKTKWT